MTDDTAFEEAPLPLLEPDTGGFDSPLYKEWFKTKTTAGFISIVPWFYDNNGKPVNKVVVDIGTVSPTSNTVESATKCYLDAISLATYLDLVVKHPQIAVEAYPMNKWRAGLNSPAGYIAYGGSGSVARIFKIEYYGANKESIGTPGVFQWKCGHFEGKTTSSGAIQPDFSKPLSQNMIRRTLVQMAEISYRLNLALSGLAANTLEWYGAKE